MHPYGSMYGAPYRVFAPLYRALAHMELFMELLLLYLELLLTHTIFNLCRGKSFGQVITYCFILYYIFIILYYLMIYTSYDIHLILNYIFYVIIINWLILFLKGTTHAKAGAKGYQCLGQGGLRSLQHGCLSKHRREGLETLSTSCTHVGHLKNCKRFTQVDKVSSRGSAKWENPWRNPLKKLQCPKRARTSITFWV